MEAGSGEGGRKRERERDLTATNDESGGAPKRLAALDAAGGAVILK